MGGKPKSKRQQVQELLTKAEKLLQQATKICTEEDLDGVTFRNETFRVYRNGYDGIKRRLYEPGWYTDEHWCSSTGHCELAVIYDEEEETEDGPE